MFSHLFLTLAFSLLYYIDRSVAQSCAAEYGQCGGQGWTGPTCCPSTDACAVVNPYYYQCLPLASIGTSSTVGTAMTSKSGSSTGPAATAEIYTTTIPVDTTSHAQSAYPAPSGTDTCGAWTLVENVCCPSYCSNNNESSDCSGCTGALCITPPAEDCMSGDIYNDTTSIVDEDWHYSRSTHFGLTSGGACGFGLYGLCTTGGADASWIEPDIGTTCSAFCTAYPQLCQDPTTTNLTMRGNFAAPNGDYYTQFWPSLPGDLDNYLSCGECFELIQTKADGTDYAIGEAGYTPPILLEIVDSCPCNANPKWCCGPGADHCGEIDFTYGCPLPEGSIHLDLSDIAMGRLQGNGSLAAGVIPTRYQRVSCPNPGNVYIWLQAGAGPYYFSLSVVNTKGLGSLISVEVISAGNDPSDDANWVALQRNQDYTSSRPQERYGAWVLPQGDGPFALPIGIRITDPSGEQLVNTEAITTYTPPATAPDGFWYIDLGMQFDD